MTCLARFFSICLQLSTSNSHIHREAPIRQMTYRVQALWDNWWSCFSTVLLALSCYYASGPPGCRKPPFSIVYRIFTITEGKGLKLVDSPWLWSICSIWQLVSWSCRELELVFGWGNKLVSPLFSFQCVDNILVASLYYDFQPLFNLLQSCSAPYHTYVSRMLSGRHGKQGSTFGANRTCLEFGHTFSITQERYV